MIGSCDGSGALNLVLRSQDAVVGRFYAADRAGQQVLRDQLIALV